MKTDGQTFLEYIAASPTNQFEARFSMVSTRLELGASLDAAELSLLYEAAFLATLCNISFNGLGGCGEAIKSERELVRTLLEREFMAARTRLFSCAGLKHLPATQRGSLERIFLNVVVSEENLH